MAKVRKALFMFVDLFGMERYNFEKLVNFIVTVKTNYRSKVVNYIMTYLIKIELKVCCVPQLVSWVPCC